LFTYWTVRSLIIFNSQLLINSNLYLSLLSKTNRDERKITKKKFEGRVEFVMVCEATK
jgi:hypothetical protein